MKTKFSCVLATLLCCVLALAAAPCAGETSAFLSEMEKRVDALMTRGEIPGIVVAFLPKDAPKPLVLARGIACVEHSVPMRPDTVMKFASTTKAVTALRVKRCIDAKLLDYDTDVRPFFPELSSPAPITVRHLLNHTSGLPDIFSLTEIVENLLLPLSQREIVRRVGQKPMRFAPGTKQEYSNTGYIVLNLLLENKKFRKTADLLGPDGLAQKLGMNALRHADNHSVVPHLACGYTRKDADKTLALPMPINADFAQGTGDLLGTAESLVMLARSAKVVKTTGFEQENLVPCKLNDGTAALSPYPEGPWDESLTDGLTLLLFPDGKKIIGKDGLYPGFSAQFWHDPATGASVAVMVNYEKGFMAAKRLALDILSAYGQS